MFDEDDPARVRALYRAACGVISSLSADAGRIMEGGAEADALAYLDFSPRPTAAASGPTTCRSAATGR